MTGSYSYHEALVRLVMRQTGIENMETSSEQAMVTKYGSNPKKCDVCGRLAHLARSCWRNSSAKKTFENKESV